MVYVITAPHHRRWPHPFPVVLRLHLIDEIGLLHRETAIYFKLALAKEGGHKQEAMSHVIRQTEEGVRTRI